eukprot:3950281-Pyramimonas_sp.AAC.1
MLTAVASRSARGYSNSTSQCGAERAPPLGAVLVEGLDVDGGGEPQRARVHLRHHQRGVGVAGQHVVQVPLEGVAQLLRVDRLRPGTPGTKRLGLGLELRRARLGFQGWAAPARCGPPGVPGGGRWR